MRILHGIACLLELRRVAPGTGTDSLSHAVARAMDPPCSSLQGRIGEQLPHHPVCSLHNGICKSSTSSSWHPRRSRPDCRADAIGGQAYPVRQSDRKQLRLVRGGPVEEELVAFAVCLLLQEAGDLALDGEPTTLGIGIEPTCTLHCSHRERLR